MLVRLVHRPTIFLFIEQHLKNKVSEYFLQNTTLEFFAFSFQKRTETETGLKHLILTKGSTVVNHDRVLA
jgi:hypothetical protein